MNQKSKRARSNCKSKNSRTKKTTRRQARLNVEFLEDRITPNAACCNVAPGDLDLHAHPLFAPGTSAAEMAKADPEHFGRAARNGKLPPIGQFQFGDNGRWSGTATDGGGLGQGTPTTLTWSIIPDGTSIHGYIGEPTSPSNLVSFFDGIYGSGPGGSDLTQRPWFPVVSAAFDRWEELTGLDYVYEPNDDGAALTQFSLPGGQLGVRGDVRIGGHTLDGGGGTLAYNFFPNAGEMVIDTADSFYFNTGGNSLRLRNVMAHEIGHGIGINHVIPINQTKLLEPFATTAFDGPQFDDILAGHRGYGDVYEKAGGNDIFSNATSLGAIGHGQTVSIGTDANDSSVAPTDTDFVSIDDNSDTDFFSFTVSGASFVDVTLTPQGPTYQQGPQSGSASSFNASAQSDLRLEIFDTNGTTSLGFVNATGVGGTETLTDILLNGAGQYYIKINGANNAAQFYRLDVSVESTVDTVGPKVNVSTPNGEAFADIDRVTLTFNEAIADNTFTLQDVAGLTGPSGNITATAVNKLSSIQYEVTFAPQSQVGNYSLTIGPDILDLAGNKMNQDGDGVNGEATQDQYTATFEIVPFKAIIDNGDNGFSTSGQWSHLGNEGYQSDINYSAAGSGNDVASWTFSVTPGQYRVSANWSTHANRATDSPFTVFDGATSLGTVRLNQEFSPDDLNEQGTWWEHLGTFDVTGTSLVVKLTDDANQYVIADGVRIERVGDLSSDPEIQVLDGSTNIADGSGSVDFGNTSPGNPISKTFTVTNLGNANLTLGSTINVPTGFTVTSGFTTTTLAPSASTTFTVQLDAGADGTYSGEVSFSNNDGDENPFNFTVSGTVSTAPQVQIIDNGDSGFSTSGQWSHLGNEGYQSDINYSAAGNGNDVASWTFTVTAGQYRVSANWSTHANRATNSPFTVFDGATSLGTTRLNQELSPNDFNEGGVFWEDIGTFVVTGDTLVVTLTDDANQYVIADGIRIERL